MRPDGGRALGGIGIGADLGVGQHVAGKIIGPGLILGVVAQIVGRDQLAQVIIAIGPVLDIAGDGAVGDRADAPGIVARIAVS